MTTRLELGNIYMQKLQLKSNESLCIIASLAKGRCACSIGFHDNIDRIDWFCYKVNNCWKRISKRLSSKYPNVRFIRRIFEFSMKMIFSKVSNWIFLWKSLKLTNARSSDFSLFHLIEKFLSKLFILLIK